MKDKVHNFVTSKKFIVGCLIGGLFLFDIGVTMLASGLALTALVSTIRRMKDNAPPRRRR
jgi:Na+/H+-translocating membrane pyrophosphatase